VTDSRVRVEQIETGGSTQHHFQHTLSGRLCRVYFSVWQQ